MTIINHETFYDAVFYCLQLLPPSEGKIFSLLCHRMSSACVVLSI